jgi:RHS repeat-associated protein
VGNVDTLSYANGTLHTYDYDVRNRLRVLGIGGPGNTGILGQTFATDASGRRTGITETTGRTVSYEYDAQARLVKEIVTADPFGANGVNNYEYDAVGNRRLRTGDLGARPPQALSYTANDWLVGDSYDANGNTRVPSPATRARDPLTDQLSLIATQDIYDFEDRLIRRQRADGSVVDYHYSADGDRVRKIVSTPFVALGDDVSYLVDTQSLGGFAQVVEERRGPSATAPSRVYVHGLATISQAQWLGAPGAQTWITHYYHHDGQSSVRALTDASGTVTDTYTYDAYGNVLGRTGASTPNTRFYAGEEFDSDLGLYYLRARYMNPETGRFHTRDSFTGYAEDPRSLHLYTYAFADPVNYRDPSGHYPMGGLAMLSYMTAYVNTLGSYTDLMMFYIRMAHRVGHTNEALANVLDVVNEAETAVGNPAQFFASLPPLEMTNLCSSLTARLRSQASGAVGEFMAEIAGCMCNVSIGVLSGFVSSGADALKTGFGMLLSSTKMFFKYAPNTPWGIYNTIADAPKLIVASQALADGLLKLGVFLYDADALDALQAFSPDLHNAVAAALGKSNARGVTYEQVCTSVGQLIGGTAFEIVMTVATVGASGALKVVRCSKLVVGAVDALDNLLPDSSTVRYLRRHTGCFVAGTLIWTGAGAMPIEQVALGTPMLTSAEHADEQAPQTRAANARRTLQVKVTFVETDTGGQAMELVTWVPPEWFPEFGEPASAIGQVRYLEDYGFAGEIAKVEVLATREPGQFADGPVVVATSRRDGPIPKVELLLADQDVEGEESASLHITTEHPVYSVTRSGWIHAGALVAGESVSSLDGGETQITSVRTYVDETPVYNLEVSDHHNYFVGNTGVLVHNADCALDVHQSVGEEVEDLFASYQSGRYRAAAAAADGLEVIWESSLKVRSEIHHIATHYGAIGKKFRSIFEDAGLDIRFHEGNLMSVRGHVGPHGKAYNDYVFNFINAETKGKSGEALTQALDGALDKLRDQIDNGPLGDVLRARGPQ